MAWCCIIFIVNYHIFYSFQYSIITLTMHFLVMFLYRILWLLYRLFDILINKFFSNSTSSSHSRCFVLSCTLCSFFFFFFFFPIYMCKTRIFSNLTSNKCTTVLHFFLNLYVECLSFSIIGVEYSLFIIDHFEDFVILRVTETFAGHWNAFHESSSYNEIGWDYKGCRHIRWNFQCN